MTDKIGTRRPNRSQKKEDQPGAEQKDPELNKPRSGYHYIVVKRKVVFGFSVCMFCCICFSVCMFQSVLNDRQDRNKTAKLKSEEGGPTRS